MATTIKLKNSVTTTNAPSSLVQGEVAINITDKKVWVGNAATTPIQLLGAGASGTFGALTCTSLTNSGLTSGRVTYASTGGLLADSANFTFNGTTVTMANDASISGLTVGKGGGAVATATVIGNGAMVATNSGADNTAIGYINLRKNTSGANNTGLGSQAFGENTTGSNNTAIGRSAMSENTTGSNNTAVGNGALVLNTTADNNTAVGYTAMYTNTTGQGNTALGRRALYSNTTASDNTAIGNQALYTNSTGTANVAVGQNALVSNTTATRNTAVGYQAGYALTTGGANVVVGDNAFKTATTADNTVAIGTYALENTTGIYNTAVGAGAGGAITSGAKNTIIGRYNGNQGGLDIRTASNYIVLSDGDGNPRIINDGTSTSVGTTATILRTQSGGSGGVVLNAQGLGISDFARASSQVICVNLLGVTGDFINFRYNGTGIGSVATNGTSNVQYLTSSDYRLKDNIAPMTGALAKVAQLNPCTYTWKSTGEAGEGFIAHELAEVCPDAVAGKKDAVDEDGKIQPQAIDTSFLVATLTAAIQELKAEVDSLKAQLNNGA